LDFTHDYTQRGGAIEILNLIDEYTFERHAIYIARMIKFENAKW